jgi:hypothetical protein
MTNAERIYYARRAPEYDDWQGDALRLPFGAQTSECLMASHFYGYLDVGIRAGFLAETRRVAERVLIVDAAWREGVQPEEVQERALHAGRWFVAAMA